MEFGKGFAVWVILIFLNFLDVEATLVATQQGIVLGSIRTSRNGGLYYSFRGMRYARPPLGLLRFAPPQEPDSWSLVYDATSDKPMCPQEWPDQSQISEDCLFINVYTKNFLTRRPVLVFIHGGSFVAGSGRSDFYGPEYLMDDGDVVVVTFNYRLGILGFFTVGDATGPGNLAFKDQVMALKWVNRNIVSFGGDPNRVTIMGYSAGAISVGLHLVSPMSAGLFHRAIAMSGTPTTRIASPNIVNTQTIAQAVGCIGNIVNCLRNVAVNDLLQASQLLNEFLDHPIRKWNWVVEGNFGQERFLVEDVNLSMLEGRIQNVPFMTGTTSRELAAFAVPILNNATVLNDLNNDFVDIVPMMLLFEGGTASFNLVVTLLTDYFNGNPISVTTFAELGQLFSDGIIRSGLKRHIDRIRSYKNVYVYTNSYVGRFSNFYYPGTQPYGMVHRDDLMYVFYLGLNVSPIFQNLDPENVMVRRMLRIITSFAANGIPLSTSTRVWHPSNAANLIWYEISDTTSPQDFLNFLPLWDSLFP